MPLESKKRDFGVLFGASESPSVSGLGWYAQAQGRLDLVDQLAAAQRPCKRIGTVDSGNNIYILSDLSKVFYVHS